MSFIDKICISVMGITLHCEPAVTYYSFMWVIIKCLRFNHIYNMVVFEEFIFRVIILTLYSQKLL